MPTNGDKVHCYGQRMLNPFHGVMNAIEIEGADAVTRDGIEWTLYLQGENEIERLDDGSECVFTTPDIKFGTWSVSGGLKRAPVRTVVDYAPMERRGQRLLDTVKHLAPQAPFPLRDRFELWLLDAVTGLPLALLDSACTLPEPYQGETRWRPGERCKREFFSPKLHALAPGDAPAASASHALRIETLINDTAGPCPAAQWFERREDGSGFAIGGINLESGAERRTLPPRCFPELLLANAWNEPEHSLLASDFTHWQAPWLLQLQNISPATRNTLEQAACRRAELTATTHRLYPEVIDKPRLKAALVASRLRSGFDRPPQTRQEEGLSPFYIEL